MDAVPRAKTPHPTLLNVDEDDTNRQQLWMHASNESE